ncbi:MAG: quinolinate synthase NadA [Desulfobacterales bacterium]|jgi:quinolinate synthase
MQDQIRSLLKKRRAILLAHNYQPPEIQEVADVCGDSLELSIRAAQTDAEVIVFCGVHFMAETASILSPQKTVLLPRLDAGCPMADMVTPAALKAKLAELPPMPVVTYVNSTAEVKALSTVCCTSANALEVLDSLDADEVLMVPDRNLALNTAARSRKIVHTWEGYCPFHNLLTVAEVETAKARHPEAVFMAHPECPPEVVALADVSVSTSGMIRYAQQSDVRAFIVGTEVGMRYPLEKACPDKTFHMVSPRMHCDDMKKIGLTDIVNCLETLQGEVKVPEDIRKPALQAVERMIAISA